MINSEQKYKNISVKIYLLMKKIYFKKPLFSIFFHNLIFKIEDKISRIIFFEQKLFKEMMINSLLIVN
jgi:hypothetical protein